MFVVVDDFKVGCTFTNQNGTMVQITSASVSKDGEKMNCFLERTIDCVGSGYHGYFEISKGRVDLGGASNFRSPK